MNLSYISEYRGNVFRLMLTTPKINFYAPVAEFLVPENTQRCSLRDREMGGLALNDPTGGLQQAVWECWYEDQYLKLKRLPDGDIILVEQIFGDVTEIGFTFDSNMRVHIVYVEDNVTKMYWFNVETSQNEIRIFEAASSPRLCLDDKRYRQSTNRDILFYYLARGALYARQQRDRYEIEYLIYTSNAIRIGQVGMATSNRVQIELIYSDDCGEVSNFLIFPSIESVHKLIWVLSNIVFSNTCLMPKSPVNVTGGEYRINSGNWSSTEGMYLAGDTLQLRVFSSSEYETTTTVYVTVGWYSGSFSVTTEIDPGTSPVCVRPPFDTADASFANHIEYERLPYDEADAEFLRHE